MAAVTKPDPIEEAHFRIDEHERKLADIGKTLNPETLAAEVRGGIAMLSAELDRRLNEHSAEMLKLTRQDVASDKEVVQGLKELVAELKAQVGKREDTAVLTQIQALCARLDTLVRALCTPTKRTAVLELPSGPATMTVRESREH